MILLAIEDITERKRIADELIRSNEDLQRFAYTAAHDLRSPLNVALNLTQLMARRVEARLDEKEREMLRTAIESLERLSTLMSDLLAYSETGNVPQQRTLVWLDEPLRFALANLQHHIEASGATITISELPSVETDRTQTAMIFQNLIGNAIKYRRIDCPLRISIEAFNWEHIAGCPLPTMGRASNPRTLPIYSNPSNACMERRLRAAALVWQHVSG